MKKLFFIMPLLIFGCSGTDISYNNNDLKVVKKVIITPFKGPELDRRIYEESERVFSDTLKKLGFEIVETGIKPAGGSGIDSNGSNIQSSGADAVLTGEILEHKKYEEKKPGSMKLKVLPRYLSGNRDNNDTEFETVYRFRIAVKMVSVKTGKTILYAENRYPESRYDPDFALTFSLDDYRKLVLRDLAEDIFKKVSGELKKN